MKASSLLLLVGGASASYDQPTQESYIPENHYTNPYYIPTSPPETTYAQPYEYIEEEAPYPFMKFPSTEVQIDNLKLPDLGSYHCFLVGAPWSQCGRRSLTSYFLDQCMAFHWVMTKNVNGICGGQPPPNPEPIPYHPYHEEEHNHYYNIPGYPVTTEAPTPAPTEDIYEGVGTGYGRTITDDYLKEKCLQKAFVSITTATVQCLTENSIRIKYIEHYAQDAASNPIEGPTLYLKKLHAFIDEVIKCTSPNEVANFPTLYKTSDNYNPNSPFYLDSSNEVSLYQYTNSGASGLALYTVGEKGTATTFLCANPKHLELYEDQYVYNSIPHSHYPDYRTDTCETSLAYEKIATSVLIRKCANHDSNDEGHQYTTDDLSLRSLYDAVHPYENDDTALRRPKTIAEIAVSGAGMIEQPILEGFGIMYYCAFYACKANNGGNTDGTCFPSFEGDDEFEYDSLTSDLSEVKEIAHEVNECIADHWLAAHEVAGASASFNLALRRSYICMTEVLNIEFLSMVDETWNTANDAVLYVYGRHLSDEKCYEEKESKCASNDILYEDLEAVLRNLAAICQANKDAYVESKHEEHHHGSPYHESTHTGYHESTHTGYTH